MENLRRSLECLHPQNICGSTLSQRNVHLTSIPRSCCLLSRSKWPHFSLPLEDALERWASPDWQLSIGPLSQRLLGSCSCGSPHGGCSKDAPCLEPLFSSHFHPSYTPAYSLGTQVLCRVAEPSRDSDSSHQLHTDLHPSAIRGSSALAHVLSFFTFLFFWTLSVPPFYQALMGCSLFYL